MYYNLVDFGKKICSIRNANKLTREKLSELSLVSVSTIRKIETGKHLPTHEILDELSNVLNIDLNKLLLTYRLDDYEEFNKIKNSLESKFDRDEYYTLEEEYESFSQLLKTTKNSHYIKLIKQLMLLIESVILYKKQENFNKALDKLIKAMKISNNNFALNNYRNFYYNETELRILMNISMTIKKINSLSEALPIIKFCIDICSTNNELYPKLCHNLSSIYSNLDDYENCLKYSNLGIEYCNNHRNLNGLNLLYYNKGTAEYKLGYKEYRDSLNKALSFCDILGQDELKKVIIHKCKKFYHIDL